VVERDGLIFGVDSTGLVESKDSGRTWSRAKLGQHLPTAFHLQGFEDAPTNRKSKELEMYQLEFQQGNHPFVLLVTNGGLFITRDNGINWCVVRFGSDMLYSVQSVAIADRDPSHILATTTDIHGPKLWESNDGGESFHPVLIRTEN
jgi:photosystem II stability/assembly factor-like uncharacterized protein